MTVDTLCACMGACAIAAWTVPIAECSGVHISDAEGGI